MTVIASTPDFKRPLVPSAVAPANRRHVLSAPGLDTLTLSLSNPAVQFGKETKIAETDTPSGQAVDVGELNPEAIINRIKKLPAVHLTAEHQKDLKSLELLLQNHATVDGSPNLNGSAAKLAQNEPFVRALMTRALKMSFKGLEQLRPYQEAHRLWDKVPYAEQRKNHWGAVGVLEGTKNGKKVQYMLESFNWFVPTGYGHVVDTVCSEKQLLLQATRLIHKEQLEYPEFKAMGFINNTFDVFPQKEAVPSDMTPCGKCLNDFQSLMLPRHITLDDDANKQPGLSKSHLRIRPDMPFFYMRRNEPDEQKPFSMTVLPISDFGKNLGRRVDSRFQGAVDTDNLKITSLSRSTEQLDSTLVKNLENFMPAEEAKAKVKGLRELLPSVFTQAKAIYDAKRLRDDKKDPIVAFVVFLQKRGDAYQWGVRHNTMYSPKTRHFYYPELRAAARVNSPIMMVGYYGQNVPINPETMEILMNKHDTVPNPYVATLQNNQIVVEPIKEELPRLYVSAG